MGRMPLASFPPKHTKKRNVNNEKAKKRFRVREAKKRDAGKCMLCYNNFITSLSFFVLSKLFQV